MRGVDAARDAGPSRRAVLTGGALLLGFAAGGGALAAKGRAQPAPADIPTPTATTTRLIPPPLAGAPAPGIDLHPADASSLQCFVPVSETGEWFTTQARAGTSGIIDPSGWAVGDIVVSRLASDGTLLDAMTLPDAGHGMGLVVRVEAGARVVYTCWFAPDDSGRLYDVVRLPYVAGTAARAAATPVVAGLGYPLDSSYDASTDSVTVRHQGGGGPEYSRHGWADFAAGDLSRPTGLIATPDWPPTHQGFCTLGDRFFFYTGAASDLPGGDPVLITEYSWASGRVVGPSLDASANSRQPDGTYAGGRMEPEGAAIIVDGSGARSLVVGVTSGGGSLAGGPKTYRTFRYALVAS